MYPKRSVLLPFNANRYTRLLYRKTRTHPGTDWAHAAKTSRTRSASGPKTHPLHRSTQTSNRLFHWRIFRPIAFSVARSSVYSPVNRGLWEKKERDMAGDAGRQMQWRWSLGKAGESHLFSFGTQCCWAVLSYVVWEPVPFHFLGMIYLLYYPFILLHYSFLEQSGRMVLPRPEETVKERSPFGSQVLTQYFEDIAFTHLYSKGRKLHSKSFAFDLRNFTEPVLF